MKKAILTLALIMSMGVTQVSWASSAPKHRYHPTTQQVDKKEAASQTADKAAQTNNDALEAYSDTTSTDTASANDMVDDDDAPTYHSKYSLGNYDDPFDFFGSVFGKGTLVFMIILVTLIGLAFVFAPLIALILIIRYLMRRHNDRVKLAEMAMEKGVNVPESERPIDKQSNEYLQKRGLRNAFLGAGLCVMFAFWGSDFLAGLGALVFFYGLGQAIIGSLPAIKQWWNGRHGNPQDTGFNGTAI